MSGRDLIKICQVTHLVLEHKDVVMLHEVSVDVFESATCCLRVEEIYEWYKRSVEDCPDDVKLPAERADADWSDLYHDEVACHASSASKYDSEISFKRLHIQFVAVPNAAPLFFIDNELISADFVSFVDRKIPHAHCSHLRDTATALPILI